MRSLEGRLRGAVFRAVTLLRGEGEMEPLLRELEARQYEGLESFNDRQSHRVKAALTHAFESVPYYQSSWGAAVSDLEGLATLPTLSKQQLQENFIDLVSIKAPSRVTRKTTGGSTGQAVTVLKDRRALAHEMAASWLAYGWYGLAPGDRYARFWGSPTTTRRRLRNAAADFATNRTTYSAFSFTAEDLESYWQRAKRERPVFFYGYASMLETFARHVIDRGHDGKSLRLKAIVSTSEVLGEPQRKLMEEAFGVPVRNEYGCGEVGPIAYECERGTLHTMSENLIVEVVKPDGTAARPGESGEILVTDLHNRAMPLVRYRVGDFAVPGHRCECGRIWPTLERVWGRAYDFISEPNGKRHHGEFVMYLFEDLKQAGVPIRQFQVLQTSASELRVKLVTDGNDYQRAARAVSEEFTRRMPELTTHIERVDAIERSRSGKLRLILNPWAESTKR